VSKAEGLFFDVTEGWVSKVLVSKVFPAFEVLEMLPALETRRLPPNELSSAESFSV